MNAEQNYCRGPLARWFNQDPSHPWLPNRNWSVGDKAHYVSGVPDGFVCWQGRFLAIECKAAFGSLYLGDPDDPDSTEGWHYHQRSWWRQVAVPSGMTYWIAAWLYPERRPARVYNQKARCYLVRPELWIETEQKLHPERKTLSANPDIERIIRFKHITAATEWSGHELYYVNKAWAIPPEHDFWKSITPTGEKWTPNDET